MATVNIISGSKMQTRSGLAFILSYCKRDAKTIHDGRKLVTGVNCIAESAYNEFMNTKLQYRKADGRMFYHLFQSFSPEECLTPETAHEIALRFASEQFTGHEVLVATHIDKGHIHSHFVVNSVNADTGKKLHADKDFLPRLRNASDELCIKYGLSVVKPKDKATHRMTAREYRSAEKGQSWKMTLAIAIEDAMRLAHSSREFISLMEAEGYEVKWTDTRKNITYTTPDGKKCCDDKLHDKKYLKENMENEFRIRRKIAAGAAGYGSSADTLRRKGRGMCYGDGAELESTDSFAEHTDRYAYGNANGYIEAYDQGRNSGLSESAVENTSFLYGEDGGSDTELSDGYAEYGERISPENGCSDEGCIITGWENERSAFTAYIFGTGENGETPENSVLDFAPADSDTAAVLVDAAYLVGDISRIIDNDHPVEDCTTMHRYGQKKKKEHGNGGPVMGGM